jgi:hypothetical protein
MIMLPRHLCLAIASAIVLLLGSTLPGGNKAWAQVASADKQGTECILDFVPARKTDSLRILYQSLPSGAQNLFLGGGVLASCRGQNMTLRADSAEYYGDQNLLYLIGNVRYREDRASIDAQRMTYWRNDEHLLAEGDVYAVTPKGATMRGPVADYFRAVPGIRSEATIYATGRPQLAQPQRDSVTGEVKDTVRMVADRIYSVNDSLVYAGGSVEITRSEMIATSDSAFMDEGAGRAQLLKNPVVNAKQKDRPFTLKGGVIDIFSTNREVDRVIAAPEGHATSNDLQLFADSIDMRIAENQLQRAMAWGESRARAVSPQHDILADSIDAILPNQRIRELRAIRQAYATTIPDTTIIITDERDWMRGDTIVAYFDTIPSASEDTTTNNNTPPIRNLIASVDARAFYHLRNNDGVKDKPGINYVRGREINIDFREREVQTVTVIDQASGVYIEPDTTGGQVPTQQSTVPEVPAQPDTTQPGTPTPDSTPAPPSNPDTATLTPAISKPSVSTQALRAAPTPATLSTQIVPIFVGAPPNRRNIL